MCFLGSVEHSLVVLEKGSQAQTEITVTPPKTFSPVAVPDVCCTAAADPIIDEPNGLTNLPDMPESGH